MTVNRKAIPMADHNHQDLTVIADQAFKAWFSDPSNRDLERNYWEACEAVRKSSIGIFKQTLGLSEINEIVTPDNPR
jgi:hypothetical protein